MSKSRIKQSEVTVSLGAVVARFAGRRKRPRVDVLGVNRLMAIIEGKSLTVCGWPLTAVWARLNWHKITVLGQVKSLAAPGAGPADRR